MTPLVLKLQAFGSYIEPVEIDFRKLKERRFFLLHGATGAGKSTLLDAIVYALYGSAPKDRTTATLRAQGAMDELATRVEFTFSIGSRYIKLEREPAYEYEKNSKKNHTSKQAFYWLSPQLQPVGTPLTGATEIGEQVNQLLGFNEKHFHQLVVLPQGQVTDFLLAKGPEKLNILQQLFDGKLYSQLVEELKNRHTQAKNKKDHQEALLQAFQNDLALEGNTNLADTLTNLQEQLSNLTLATDKLRKSYEEALINFNNAERDAFLIEKAQHYQQELMLHLANPLTQLLQQQQLAERANPFKDLLQKGQLLQETLTKEQEKGIKLQASFEGLTQEYSLAEVNHLEAQKERENLPAYQQQVAQLQQWRVRVAARQQAEQVLQQKQTYYDERLQAVTAMQLQVNALKLTLNQQEALGQQLQAFAQQIPTLQTEVKEILRIAELRKTRTILRDQFREKNAQLRQLNQQQETALQQLTQAQAEEAAAEHNWLGGQAAELAKLLQPDQACPVCGSIHHPNPAIATTEQVATQQYHALRKSTQTKRALVEEIMREVVAMEEQKKGIAADGTRVNTEMEQLGDWAALSDEEFAKRLQQAEEALQQAISNSQTRERYQAEIREQLTPSYQQKTDLLTQETLTLHTAETDYQVAKHALAQIVAELPLHLPEDLEASLTSLENKLQHIEQRYTITEQALRHAALALQDVQTEQRVLNKSLQELRQDLILQEAALEKGWHRAGFESKEALVAALLTPAQLAQITAQLQQWEQKKTELATSLALAEEQTKNLATPNLPQLLITRQQATDLWLAHQGTTTAVEQQIQHLGRAQARIMEMETTLATLNQEQQAIYRLYAVASGAQFNKDHQPFDRYIMAHFFDQVVVLASERLQRMSDGRFLLRRTDELGKHQQRGGFELEVLDNNLGKYRSVNTLSGGEKFMTALALALALAGVASARAGGRQLETVFIDEGFGSLDTAQLEKAIQVLHELEAEEGKLIGIISHVDLLKEHIPTRLEVIQTPNGSKANWHIN